MHYKITPFCLGRRIVMADPMGTLAREDNHRVQAMKDYEERMTLECEAENDEAACEEAWTRFQNLDEGHMCPDNGRSLMVGDMVRLESEDGTSWWICCSFGWAKTVAPGNERQVIGE